MGSNSGTQRLSPDRLARFPRLSSSDYEVTSNECRRYNCVAYAAGDETRKWDCPSIPEPGYYWPPGAIRGDEVAALVSAFQAIGYEVCQDGKLETGFEKVAIYVDHDGQWTHAAKQREDDGHWSSKLGDWEDTRHATLMDIGDGDYGVPYCFLRRPTGFAADEKTRT